MHSHFGSFLLEWALKHGNFDDLDNSENQLPTVHFFRSGWMDKLVKAKDGESLQTLFQGEEAKLSFVLGLLKIHNGQQKTSWDPEETPNCFEHDGLTPQSMASCAVLHENIRDKAWEKAKAMAKYRQTLDKSLTDKQVKKALQTFKGKLRHDPSKKETYRYKSKWSDHKQGQGSKWDDDAWMTSRTYQNQIEPIFFKAKKAPASAALGSFDHDLAKPPEEEPQKEEPQEEVTNTKPDKKPKAPPKKKTKKPKAPPKKKTKKGKKMTQWEKFRTQYKGRNGGDGEEVCLVSSLH